MHTHASNTTRRIRNANNTQAFKHIQKTKKKRNIHSNIKTTSEEEWDTQTIHKYWNKIKGGRRDANNTHIFKQHQRKKTKRKHYTTILTTSKEDEETQTI